MTPTGNLISANCDDCGEPHGTVIILRDGKHYHPICAEILFPNLSNELDNDTTERRLEKALRDLLSSDGHRTGEHECQFSGCTCGGAENYAAARTEAWRLLREISE